MDIFPDFQTFKWYKKDWNLSKLSEIEKETLYPCLENSTVTISDNLEEIIQNSYCFELFITVTFPIKFPIDTIRLEKLKQRKPIQRLKRNIVSTYPLIHERVLHLMAHFLVHKREYGSNIEKEFYKEMTVPQLIDRILKKRAISFVGSWDKYVLISGAKGSGGWEQIGTQEEKPPLLLKDCLSYDEMKLSAMVYVSGYTECINDGDRHNKGVVNEDNVEQEAVIIGLIGPRFTRKGRMDFEDILITDQQNIPENGYGEDTDESKYKAKKELRNVWSKFFETKPPLYKEISSKAVIGCEVKMNESPFKKSETEDGSGSSTTNTRPPSYRSSPMEFPRRVKWGQRLFKQFKREDRSVSFSFNKETSKANGIQFDEEQYMERYIHVTKGKDKYIFDNEVYYKRLCIIAESTFMEAEFRAKECGKSAFVNVIGCGLGVWMISGHQCDVYVLAFLQRARELLRRGALQHVADINFAYINISSNVEALFSNRKYQDHQFPNRKKLFLECKMHPNGGINVQMENRKPCSKLVDADAGKLLVLTYPWDSNAHPGNEFWYGSLHTSGDPAAACSTQVAELHNAHINPCVAAQHTRIITEAGIRLLSEYCSQIQ